MVNILISFRKKLAGMAMASLETVVASNPSTPKVMEECRTVSIKRPCPSSPLREKKERGGMSPPPLGHQVAPRNDPFHPSPIRLESPSPAKALAIVVMLGETFNHTV